MNKVSEIMPETDSNQLKTAALNCDIFISGGGPVGLILAIGLARLGQNIVIAEKTLMKDLEAGETEIENSFDGRVLALSKGSQEVLNNYGIWESLQPYCVAIEHVHVTQKGYLGLTTLHAEEVDVEALGYSVQSNQLGKVLWQEVAKYPNINVLRPATLLGFNCKEDSVEIDVEASNQNYSIHSNIIVGADGTQSKVRALLNLPLEEKSYDAFGVLAQIKTELHPNGWAYERFTEEGPVALLPMFGHSHKAVLVCPKEKVDAVCNLSDEDYLKLFASKMGERLGRFTEVSAREVYPLKESYAPKMTDQRGLLMGNASHTQHPVAAQGLNLGIRDIEVFVEQATAGLAKSNGNMFDIGGHEFLQQYAQSRKNDHRKVMGLTDSLIQLFQHGSSSVGHLRGLGMMALQAMPSVKRKFAKFAMRGQS
jgi:2-octaprenyl-6-methoxyphenol hydroxylase